MNQTAALLPFANALRAHWRSSLLVAAMAALWLVAGFSLVVQGGMPRLGPPRAEAAPAALRQAVPQTAATRLKAISVEDAIAWNASVPLAGGANPAARPFIFSGSAADRLRSLDCLTAAIYYEAAREPLDGQRAVAQVVLNRVRHPAYPNSVCGVVFEGARRTTGCQFTFSCDGSLRRAPIASLWEQARRVADSALSGYVHAPVGWATHYHANYVVPYWAPSLTKAATVGAHIFYRWQGGWGRPAAFTSRHSGVEPAIAWRGGFGQPTREELAAADARDAAAAAAAEQAHGGPASASVDSFHRAVLRRYEPLRRETADAVIAERAKAGGPMTTSQRWALTGSDEGAAQTPLGTRAQPAAAEQAPPPAAREP